MSVALAKLIVALAMAFLTFIYSGGFGGPIEAERCAQGSECSEVSQSGS